MKFARLLVATTLLGGLAPLAAQSDPVTGTWTGDIGLDLVNRFPLKLALKLDGAALLTGAVTSPTPAAFKSGSFDGTTGAIKIELTPTDGGVPFILEGTAIAGVATGRVSDGTRTGSFRIARVDAGSAPPASDAAAALRKQFGLVSGWISKSAEVVPADKYSYQPTKDVRSFGQIVAHVADALVYYCALGAGKKVQWADAIEKGATDKATLTPKLKQALDGCTAAYAAAGGDADPLTENLAHSNLHYGNLITYMRLMGIVPPSSR